MTSQVIHTYSVTIGESIRCLKRISYASELSRIQNSYTSRCCFCFGNVNIRLSTKTIVFQTNIGSPKEDRRPSIVEQGGFWVGSFDTKGPFSKFL